MAMNIQIYTVDLTAGLIMSGYLAVYLIIALLLYHFKRAALLHDLVEYSMRFHVTVNRLAENLDIPLSVLGPDGRCIWENKHFHHAFSQHLNKKYLITEAIPALTLNALPESADTNGEMHFHDEEIFYKAILQRVDLERAPEKIQGKAGEIGIGDTLYVVYVYDETEIVHYIRENYDQRLDVGLLYIDNYEESLDTVDDVRRALLAALIDRKINKYMLKIDAITRKMEKDKYIFLFQHKYLSQLQADKFSLLDDIRGISAGDDISITISMGIGIQADTFRKRQDYARSAMDLALARGGDQVVVKTRDNILYYGGKSIQQQKNTRVKARVKAHALRDSIENSDKIIIMGHTIPDVDAIGGAIGIYRIAQSLGKPTRIVVNQVTSSLAPLLHLFENNKDYPEDLFVDGENAKEFIGNGSGVLLVVVDVNRPSYTDAPELLSMAASLVVIDHHRQTGESFENPTLSYIEPFASSACEMVAEIVQYAGEEIRLKAVEADALYSGIMIDTNNFMNKPGVRTFEAVAFLRRSGADIMRIRKMFRSDISEYKVRAEAIQNTELFMDAFAIAPCNADNCISPTIVGAKIADELLDIKGMKASFVLTSYEGKIYISARSIDELNVQVVMEKLGGGGHITSAGTQLTNCTLEEAADKIRQILTKMKEEGDIE
ncbi:MAG: DHH family phosphoesterase [Lachnospiraceae bacterium]|nr:DHH family phosphoesterase [Lachnospiraceae bacterium]